MNARPINLADLIEVMADRIGDRLAAEAAAAGSQVRLFSVGPLMHGGSQWMLGSSAVAGGVYVLYTQGGFDAEKVRAPVMIATASLSPPVRAGSPRSCRATPGTRVGRRGPGWSGP